MTRRAPTSCPGCQKVQSRQVIPYLDEWTSAKVTGASFHAHWKEWTLRAERRPRRGGGGEARTASPPRGPHDSRHSPDEAPLQPRRRLDRVHELQPHPLPADPPRAPRRLGGSPARRSQRRLGASPGRPTGRPWSTTRSRSIACSTASSTCGPWTWPRAACAGSPAASAPASPTSRPTAAASSSSAGWAIGASCRGRPGRDGPARPHRRRRRRPSGATLAGAPTGRGSWPRAGRRGMARHRAGGRGLGGGGRAHPRPREGRRAHLHPRRAGGRVPVRPRRRLESLRLPPRRWRPCAGDRRARRGLHARGQPRRPARSRSPLLVQGLRRPHGRPRPRDRVAGRAVRRPLPAGRPLPSPPTPRPRARIARSTRSGRASGRP